MLGDLYNRNGIPLSEGDYRCQVSMVVNKVELLRNENFVEHAAVERMHAQLARFVVNARMRRTEYDHSVEFRMDLFVFDPDEFWSIVEATAERMLQRRR